MAAGQLIGQISLFGDIPTADCFSLRDLKTEAIVRSE